jgi:F-type H+-transporting ATPase subunit b
MRIDLWTLALQAVNVLVLIWILSRFLFRPVSAMIVARQKAATEALDAARAAKQVAESEKDEAKAAAAQVAAGRTSMLEDAVTEAETEKAALLAAARAEAERLRAAAKSEMALLRQNEEAEAADRASQLAVDIAAKLFDRLPQECRITGFIDGLVQGVAALPEASRAEIGIDGAPLYLKAARALSDTETQACCARLADVLHRPVRLIVEADPNLIAGLELAAPHAVVRNHFRADLDRIAAELARHE